ncbi:ATP--cob(I)alamin adenosyltransferase [Planctomycetales bacterium]|nr:ATP--cob(I)alamin adenosyltransferase [Planctomycetales bacterium]
MRIYTRSGDKGQTSLYGGMPVAKDQFRIEVCGNIDELSATLGMVRAEGLTPKHENILLRIQNELIAFGSEIASPNVKSGMTQEHIQQIENEIDELEQSLPPLTQFVLPGKNKVSATLHFARTVCRRAERSLVTLARHTPNLSPILLAYLNRLSDLLFVMGRS